MKKLPTPSQLMTLNAFELRTLKLLSATDSVEVTLFRQSARDWLRELAILRHKKTRVKNWIKKKEVD